ncbi:MAG: FecR domain-containing protein [Pseudomonadota bacterium]
MSSNEVQTNENIRQTAHYWRARISSGDVSETEQDQFNQWRQQDERHELAYDRAVTLYSALGEIKRNDYEGDIFKPLLRERFFRVMRQAVDWLQSSRELVSASTFAMIVVIGLFVIIPQISSINESTVAFAPVINSFSTEKNRIRNIDFPDGSKVTLGAETQIETTFSESERKVRILGNGDVFFDVAKDTMRPFIVDTGDLTVEVLGTSFDVRASGGIHRVAVAEGQVEIGYPQIINGQRLALTTKTQLTPGEQISATLSKGLSKVSVVERNDIGAWRERRLIYKSATIAELIADASRYDERQIEIEAGSEGILNLRLSGVFSSDDIDRMLLTLADIHPIDVDLTTEKAVVIRRRSEQN